VWVFTVITACDKKHDRHDILLLLDGLKLGYGFLLIVVNCCAACRGAMCVGYMKCLLSLTCSLVPFDVHFQLGLYSAKRAETRYLPCLIYAQPD